MWDSCYECGNDYVGTADDIETLVGWAGEAGALTKALVEAGFIEFVEVVEDERTFRVHDLWHHAPSDVYRRWSDAGREARQQHRRTRRALVRRAGGSLSTQEWLAILKAFGGRCAYCRLPLDEATQDHAVPLTRGGRHDASNVVPACRSCNSRKGRRTAAEFTAANGTGH